MNIVTKSHFDQFRQQYGYEDASESEAFELFCIYSVLSRYVKSETISRTVLEDLNIGGGGDWGIDGVIVIVNGRVTLNEQEVADLLTANGDLRVRVILVQAKTSIHFSTAQIGQVLDGAEYLLKDVLGYTELPPSNDDLLRYRELIKYIYSKSADFRKGINPALDVYYVTCGEYEEQQDFASKIASAKEYIEGTCLVSSFNCFLYGSQQLIKLYRESKSAIENTIKVEHKLSLPEIPNVSEGYVCLIPFSEFKRLIINDDGTIIESVFYDNIRAFQGDTLVNKAMAKTLKDGDISLFSAMNNGITIIAKAIKVTGQKIHLVDYQIVNGCQTCNVLQQNQDVPNLDSLCLTVKIIQSTDKEIRDKIIVGNNSQTEVKREQLVALLESQRLIEEYYNAQNKYVRLYYERRSKQYMNGEIPQYKIVTIPQQIMSYVSMMLGEPHKVCGYYGSIVEQYDKAGVKVFSPNISPALYYTSAFALYRMTELFDKGFLPKNYRKIKYHLLFAVRLMCEKKPLSGLQNEREIEAYCEHLCEIFNNNETCEMAFNAAKSVVFQALGRGPSNTDPLSASFTEKIKQTIQLINQYRKKKE